VFAESPTRIYLTTDVEVAKSQPSGAYTPDLNNLRFCDQTEYDIAGRRCSRLPTRIRFRTAFG
jgi:hypothetical protein